MIKPLTSLRAFAALYVLFFHSGSQYLIEKELLTGLARNFALNGYLGVSFFFILSGFILQYVYDGRLCSAAERFRYGRARFARIYPVYLLALLMTATFAFEPRWSAVPQFLMLHYWNVPTFGAPDNWNFPSWTLSVELFFYIAFLWLSPLVTRLDRRRLLVALAVVAALMIYWCSPALLGPPLEQSSMSRDALYLWVPLPLLRLPEFALGVILKRATDLYTPSPRIVSAVFATSVTAMLVVLAADFAIWVANAFALCVAGVIWSIAQMESSRVFKLLSDRRLFLLGAASYALYILQFPVRKWMKLIDIWPNHMIERLAYYPILVMLSILVFLMIEEKLRERLRWTGGK